MKFLSKPFPLLVVLILCLLFVSIPPATTAAPASQLIMLGSQINVLLDPNIDAARIPVPRQFSPARAPAMSITVNYSPIARWGDSCGAWSPQAQVAFSYAMSIWASLLTSSVPVTIDACWATNLSPGVLGHGGALNYYGNFSGAPVTNTWYPVALANSRRGLDLDSANADIYLALASTFSWYLGTDGVTPPGQVDLVSVVLHEIGHGLGFSGSMQIDNGSGGSECNGINGYGCWGLGTAYPIAYDRFTKDLTNNDLINTSVYANPSASLGTALTSSNVYFSGTNANAANGGTRVKLYAPATWSSGSSYAHLDYDTYRFTGNRLMVYMMSSGSSIHDPGPVTLGIMKDIGWQMVASCFTLSTSVSPGGAGSVNANPSPNCNGTQYNSGSVVTLTASANGGYTFFGWAGDAGGTINPTTVTMSADRNVIASFNPASFIPKYIFLPLLKK